MGIYHEVASDTTLDGITSNFMINSIPIYSLTNILVMRPANFLENVFSQLGV